MNILDALEHQQIFASAFRDPGSWKAWHSFLRVLFGLPLSDADRALFHECSGRHDDPNVRFTEAWLICGRRAGKSFMMAVIAVFLACFRDYRQYLAPGERATIMIIAADRKQARVVFRYIRGLLSIPVLAALVERETAESFDLNTSVTIEVATASYRTIRGYSIAAAICDEIAFWPSEDSTSPDTEILDALRPAMGTIPGAMLIAASSPYARRGALWEAYQRHYGKDGAKVLVWKAPTRTMNISFPQTIIDDAIEADPAAAGAEYMAEFRSDIASFVAREVVEASIIPGRFELPPSRDIGYVAFVDPSGGSADSFTLAIAHRENELGVLDVVREYRPPFSPDNVVSDIASTLAAYDIDTIQGDRYAGQWPVERFLEKDIRYEQTARPKSDIYRDALPLINSGRIELLDHRRLASQIFSLERRTARGGRDSIDHAPGAHDDLANAALGALVLAAGGVDRGRIWELL
jgi:hypothetical protein